MSPHSRIALAAGFLAALVTPLASAADAPLDAQGAALPPGAVVRLGSIRMRHALMGVAWAPDGKSVASAGMDGTVRLWNPDDGKEIRRFPAANALPLNSVRFLADGKLLAAMATDGGIHVWDAATGREVRCLPPGPGLVLLTDRVAPGADDGTLGAINSDNIYRLFDLATGKAVRQLAGGPSGVRTPQNCLSADGRRFAEWTGAADDSLAVWDPADGKELVHARTGLKTVTGITLSPDGKWAAVFGGAPPEFSLWDVDADKEIHRLAGGAGACAAFTPNGKYLVALGADRQLHLYGVASGQELRQLPGPLWNSATLTLGPAPLAFSPDGKKLAGGRGTAVRIWDVQTGEETLPFQGHAGPVTDLHFSPDGRRLTSVSQDGTARQWDAAAARQTAEWTSSKGLVYTAAAAPDGKTVLAVTGAGLVRVDFADGKPTEQILAPPISGVAPSGLAVAPDGKTVAGKWHDGKIHLWDVKTGKDSWQAAGDATGFLAALAFSPDGRVLAAACPGLRVRLLDATTGQELHQLNAGETAPLMSVLAPASFSQPHGVVEVAFSPDDREVLCVSSGELSLWETSTGGDRMRVVHPGVNFTQASFSPANDLLAVGTSNGTVLLLDAQSGFELAALEDGHTGAVTALEFAADGRTLASGGMDGDVLLWDVKAWRNRSARTAELKAEKLPALWKKLVDPDAGAAYRAILALSASPRAAAYLKDRLCPAASAEDKQVAKLIHDLDDDSFDTRESAQKELEKMGEAAWPALRRALDSNPAAEARQRLERLLARQKESEAVAEDVRDLRALEALERSGAPEAAEMLRSLMKEAPTAAIKQEAAAAVDRLNQRASR